MLRGAVQKHEQENVLAKAASKPFFSSSPPERPSQVRNSQGSNPGYRNPLKPTCPSTLNVSTRPWEPPRLQNGIKRTASGLAKAMNGAFEDPRRSQGRSGPAGSSSSQRGVLHLTPNDLVNEDAFDSDIDLDIEEPAAKRRPSYPKLPKSSDSTQTPRPVVYPTLPRQQQVQSNVVAEPDLEYAAVQHASQRHLPDSSAPAPWSSSPVEHFMPARNLSSVVKSFSYNPTGKTQRGQNGPPPPQPVVQAQPAKRRRLPWQVQQEAETVHDGAGEPEVNLSSHGDPTLLSKASKKSAYPWNTSASAVKEQQKRHREDNKKAIKKNEGTEEAIQKAKTSCKRPARVFLSEEQQHVVELVTEHKKSVFFTGSAGTGKSVLMREIITSLRKKYVKEADRVAVTASTGLAACNVGGVTLHSFAGIGLGKEDVQELVKKIKKNQKAKHRWMRTKVLVIDEVSMVDGELFDKLESIARQLRNNGRPFGGIQLVITGDFFQLPPVPDSGRVARFAFDAATWSTTIEHTIGLHHVFRQKDPIFAGMLNEMREGRLTQSSIEAFRNLSRGLTFEDQLEATELFPTRNEVDVANQTRLQMLQGEVQIFEARDGGSIVDKAQRDKLLQNCMAPQQIVVKKGAQVMLIKNMDDGLVNGSIGKVIGFMDEAKFDRYHNAESGDCSMKDDGTLATQQPNESAGAVSKTKLFDSVAASSRMWPVVRFALADGTSRDLLCQPEIWKVELPNGEIQASRSQIPLILAWALSIHKAQGQTLERVKVDLGKVFEKGQAYVALSRATSMKGLQVLRFDPKKVVAHEKVRTFYSKLARFELAEKNKGRTGGPGKSRQSSVAEDYEKRFLEDGWADMP